jgi:hypothetical protein
MRAGGVWSRDNVVSEVEVDLLSLASTVDYRVLGHKAHKQSEILKMRWGFMETTSVYIV